MTVLLPYLLLCPSKRCSQTTPRRVYQEPSPNSFGTATQQVLSTPELVSEILSFDAAGYREDHWAYGQTFFKNDFARYARVNSVWFHEAMRYLWWTPMPFDKLSVLAGLPHHRKQKYAQFMVKLSFRNDPGPWGGSREENVILQGLHLSSLRFARIQISAGQKLLSLPGITSVVLQDLTIDVVQFKTGKGGALSDDGLRKRFAKRLKVGPSARACCRTGLKLLVFRKCSLV